MVYSRERNINNLLITKVMIIKLNYHKLYFPAQHLRNDGET